MEAQRIITTGNQGQKVIRTAIKNEDKEEKPVIKLEESEMRLIEAKNKERNKNKKWPHDARLVHIDSTACSLDCMKNSDYHKEMDEIEFNRINRQKQQEKLTVATLTLNSNATDNNTNSPTSVHQHAEITESNSAHIDKQTQLEQLTVATPTVKEKTSTEVVDTTNELTAEYCESLQIWTKNQFTEGNVETTNNMKTSIVEKEVPPDSDSDELTGAMSVTKFTKKYNIDKSTNTATIQELPDIPERITTDTLPNIESITTDCNLLNTDTFLPTTDRNLLSIENSPDINLPPMTCHYWNILNSWMTLRC